jgi:hypothetical protein
MPAQSAMTPKIIASLSSEPGLKSSSDFALADAVIVASEKVAEVAVVVDTVVATGSGGSEGKGGSMSTVVRLTSPWSTRLGIDLMTPGHQ